MRNRPINEENTKFGLSILHCWIRVFECLLHISYKLEYTRPRCTKPEHRIMEEEKKKKVQAEIKLQLGLVIDKPKPSYGSSNDGNTARRLRGIVVSKKVDIKISQHINNNILWI